MRNCCVPFCSSTRKTQKICFHQIPSDEPRRTEWLKRISREGIEKGSQWIPNQYSTVCELHFTPDSYKLSSRKKLLKPTAVPSIFPKYPKHKQLQNKQLKNIPCRKSDSLDSNFHNLHLLANLASSEVYSTVPKEIASPTSNKRNRILVTMRQRYQNKSSLLSKYKKNLKSFKAKYAKLAEENKILLDKIQSLNVVLGGNAYDAYPTIFNYKTCVLENDESTECDTREKYDLPEDSDFNGISASIHERNIEKNSNKFLNISHNNYQTDFMSSSTAVETEKEVESDESSIHFWMNVNDEIIDISNFKLYYQSKLPNNWLILSSDDDIYIGKINLENIPELLITIKINSDLSFNVWYKNILIKNEEFLWLFGEILKFKSWTKFECLIQHLNKTDLNSLDLQLKSIRNTLAECARQCKDKKMLTKLLIVSEHVKFLSFTETVENSENCAESGPSTKVSKASLTQYETDHIKSESSFITNENRIMYNDENNVKLISILGSSKRHITNNFHNEPSRKARKSITKVNMRNELNNFHR